jgi:gas vesicle protein
MKSIRIAAIGIVPALVGAAAALLLAPQSGRRTRRQIRLIGERCWYSMSGELQRAGDLLQVGAEAANKAARTAGRKLRLLA